MINEQLIISVTKRDLYTHQSKYPAESNLTERLEELKLPC